MNRIEWRDTVRVEGLRLDLPTWAVSNLRLHVPNSVQCVVLHFSAMNKLLLDEKGDEWYEAFVNEVFAGVSAANKSYAGSRASIEDVTVLLPSDMVNKYGLREISLVIQHIILSHILMGIFLVRDQGKAWYSEFARRCDEELADYEHLLP